MVSKLQALGFIVLTIGLCSCPSDTEEFEGDEAGECEDRADNDRDGLFDCDDDGCSGSLSCPGGDGDADSDSDGDGCAPGLPTVGTGCPAGSLSCSEDTCSDCTCGTGCGFFNCTCRDGQWDCEHEDSLCPCGDGDADGDTDGDSDVEGDVDADVDAETDADVGVSCGDGVCTAGESAASCPSDCSDCTLLTGEIVCDACLLSTCESECASCSLNPDCVAMADCIEGCAGSGECEMACAESHEDGFWDFVAYFGDAGCMGDCGVECL